MKVAILTSHANSFRRIQAEGLARMLARLDVSSKVYYYGLRAIRRLANAPTAKNVLRTISPFGIVRRTQRSWLLRELRNYDVVVVCEAINAFMKDTIDDNALRACTHAPVVLYQNYYLPTRGDWVSWLRDGNSAKGVPAGGYGLERFDWYLCASAVGERPMPHGPQPCSLIGIDLDDGSLYPDQKGEFIALLDFLHPDFPAERAIQINALKETNTPFIELKGEYSIAHIRSVYRRCSIYFLATHESFGLPICELQACGSYVFTPYAQWCESHYCKADLTQRGPGRLTSNFVVYDNDFHNLVNAINRLKSEASPTSVRNLFQREQGHLYYGDSDALRAFIRRVRNGEIRGRSV
jgi:hypothetical protein